MAVFDYVSNRSYVGFTKQRLVRLDPAQGPVANGIKMRLQSTGQYAAQPAILAPRDIKLTFLMKHHHLQILLMSKDWQTVKPVQLPLDTALKVPSTIQISCQGQLSVMGGSLAHLFHFSFTYISESIHSNKRQEVKRVLKSQYHYMLIYWSYLYYQSLSLLEITKATPRMW